MAKQSEKAAEFFAVLLHAATIGHMLHLQTGSFAAHSALNDFYDELPDLVDELVEAYQGKFGIVEDYPFDKGIKIPSDPIKFVEALSTYVDQNRNKVSDRSNHQNIIDEIATLIDKTAYKLKTFP
jgi:hypothetical protein